MAVELYFDFRDTSALSHHDFRVDRFQFDPGIGGLELPVDAALPGVAVVMPGRGF